MTLKEMRFLADVSDGVAVKVRVPTGDFLKLVAVAAAAESAVQSSAEFGKRPPGYAVLRDTLAALEGPAESARAVKKGGSRE